MSGTGYRRIWLSFSILMWTAVASTGAEFIGPTGFKNCTPEKIGGAGYTLIPGVGIDLSLPHRDAELWLKYGRGSTAYTGTTYLRFTVQNTGPTPVETTFSLECGSTFGSETALGTTILIPNDRAVTMLMPLFKPQSTVKMPMFPSVNGSMYQLRTLGAANLGDVRRLRILNRDWGVPLYLRITNISSMSYPIVTTRMVDAMGQQNNIVWPAKIDPNNNALLLSLDPPLSGQFPYGSDQFGGIAGTGSVPRARFGTYRDANGRWSLIAPSGNRFFSTGVCGVGACIWTLVSDRPSYFDSLPSKTGEFGEHWSQTTGTNGLPIDTFNFYRSNLEKKYGPTWKQQFYPNVIKRMKSWGFNTMSAAFDHDFPAGTNFPSAPVFGIFGTHQRLPVVRGGSLLHDTYDPAFPNSVQSSIAAQLLDFPESSYQIGLFIDNEMPWGDMRTTYPPERYMVPYAVLRGPATLPSKVKFIANLTAKYGTISQLNTSWGTAYSSWSALSTGTFNFPAILKPGMITDFNEFTLAFARKYFQTVRNALNNLSYGGLYLGCRLDAMTPEVIQACKESADVLSFNSYDKNPEVFFAHLKDIDFPVLISEFGFGASDNGRIGWGLYQTLSEADRITAYQNYVNKARTWKNLVGFHYFRWEDNPPSGDANIPGLADNTTSGLVSITDIPYPYMTLAASIINTSIMQSYVPIP